jgi:hypothetical protein
LINGLLILGSNATISDCDILGAVIPYSAAGLVLRNNIFSAVSPTSILFAVAINNSNILIENNLFTSGAKFHFDGNGSVVVTNVTVRNNVFLGSSASSANLINAGSPTNWSFQNNIFWNIAIAPSSTNSAFINNIAYSPNGAINIPITNGGMNVGNINADPQFVNYSGGGYSSAHNYRLQAASLGHLAGTDGTDIGAFGGATPHTDHGMPNIPVMKVMNITGGAVPVGGTIQVTFQSTIQN